MLQEVLDAINHKKAETVAIISVTVSFLIYFPQTRVLFTEEALTGPVTWSWEFFFAWVALLPATVAAVIITEIFRLLGPVTGYWILANCVVVAIAYLQDPANPIDRTLLTNPYIYYFVSAVALSLSNISISPDSEQDESSKSKTTDKSVEGMQARVPVGVMPIPNGEGRLVVCSDGAVFEYNPGIGGGIWVLQKPVPGTRADADRESKSG